MGNDNGCSTFTKSVKGCLDLGLGDTVQGTGCLVQDDDGRVLQEHTGNADPLLLTAGEHHAPLAHIGLVPVGHVQDVLVDLCQFGRPHHLFIGGFRPSVPDVLHNGICKEEDILLYDADLSAEGTLGHIPHILPIHPNAAIGHIIEPGDQLTDGSFTTAAGAYKGELLPCFDMQVYPPQDFCLFIVAEGDMIENNISLHVFQLLSIGLVLDLRVQTHQLQETGKARRAHHELFHKGRELSHRGDEGGHIQSKGQQVGVIYHSLHDIVAACADDQNRHDGHAEFQAAHVSGHGLIIPPLGLDKLAVHSVELGFLGLFILEGLGRAHPGDPGLNGGIDFRRLCLQLQVGFTHSASLIQGEGQEEGHDAKSKKGQPPLNGTHDTEGTDQRHRGNEQVFRAVMGQLRDLKEVVGHPGHEDTGAVLIVEAEAQTFQMGVKVPAKVGLHPNAEKVSPIGDREIEKALGDIGTNENRDNDEKHPIFLIGQKIVDHLSGGIGEGQVNEADQQSTGHIQNEQMLVRPVIGQEYLQRVGLFIIDVFAHRQDPPALYLFFYYTRNIGSLQFLPAICFPRRFLLTLYIQWCMMEIIVRILTFGGERVYNEERKTSLILPFMAIVNQLHRLTGYIPDGTLPQGMTISQLATIAFLYFRPDQETFQKDVEQCFKLRRSTVSSLLNTLEKKNLIQRVTVPQDARLKKLILTDEARQIGSSIHGLFADLEAFMFQDISAEDLATLDKVFAQVQRNLNRLEDTSPGGNP